MPFTAYHFGPSGFIGLSLKRWLDIPVFVLANVIVDFEVLLAGGGYHSHRHWHWHTLLIGAVVGVIFGISVFPFRKFFSWIMNLLRVPYKPTLLKMAVAGALGVCLHVLIDACYHYDVQPFWPFKNNNPLYRFARSHHIAKPQIVYICIGFWIAAFILYAAIVIYNLKKAPKSQKEPEK